MSHQPIPAETLRISDTTHRLEGHEHGADVSFFLVDYPPGRGTDLHRHPYAEVFVLQSGEAEFTVGEERVAASESDVVVVPAGTAHRFQAAGEGRLRMICIHASGVMESELL
jgi:mannose-6-phosphate isomerase-like protein (cupin superfamily)